MDHCFVLNELINIYLHKKKRLYCCFIDYQKAFDTIIRSALWGKVISNGINGKILRVIYNMYDNAKSCVKQQSMISGLFACNVGVRQGENLSPLLFAMFLNDFETSLSSKYNGLTTINELSRILGTEDIEFFINMYILLYADDTLVMAESPTELQLALDEVGVYCNNWGLSINQTKTEVVIFSRGRVKTQYNFKIGDINIGTTSQNWAAIAQSVTAWTILGIQHDLWSVLCVAGSSDVSGGYCSLCVVYAMFCAQRVGYSLVLM
jgi:hypothetical protein